MNLLLILALGLVGAQPEPPDSSPDRTDRALPGIDPEDLPAEPDPSPSDPEAPEAPEDTLLPALDDSLLMQEDVLPGEPNLFEDLESDEYGADLEPIEGIDEGVIEEPGAGGGGGFDLGRAFDAGVLLGELLPAVFAAPLQHEGIRFGVGANVTYDSNLFLEEDDPTGDLSFTLSPSVEYRSAPPGVPGLVTVRYTPFLRAYLQESDLNTIDHSAGATVSFTGTRGSIAAAANYGRFSHADRYVGGLVETENFSGSVNGSYRVAPRTTLNASLSANYSEDSGRQRTTTQLPGVSDNRTMSMQAGGLWQATSRSSFGPSLRYSHSSSSTSGDRNAVAFLLVGETAPREGLNLNGDIGLEKVESDQFGESGDVDFTGSIGVSYVVNERLSLQGDLSYVAIPQGRGQFGRNGGGSRSLNGSLAVRYAPNPDWILAFQASADSFPSADSGNYSIGDQNYTVSVTRLLPTGSLTLDGSLGFSSYDAVGPVAAVRRDDELFRSIALRYRRPVFAERASLNASAQASQNSGTQDWERYQLSLGLDFAF